MRLKVKNKIFNISQLFFRAKLFLSSILNKYSFTKSLITHTLVGSVWYAEAQEMMEMKCQPHDYLKRSTLNNKYSLAIASQLTR